jgi:hypothetical protein
MQKPILCTDLPKATALKYVDAGDVVAFDLGKQRNLPDEIA